MRAWMASSILLGAGVALAGSPATRPVAVAPPTPAVPIDRGGLVDRKLPAFVPRFVTARTPMAGPVAEREYASRYTYPAPVWVGYGYGGYELAAYGWPGFARGTWGRTTPPFW